MALKIFSIRGLMAVLCLPLLHADVAYAGPTLEPDAQQLLATFCVDCHTGSEPSGGIVIDTAVDADHFYQQGRNWLKAVRVVRQSEMPPADADQPSDEEREALWRSLDATLVRVADQFPTRVGKVTVRRLNRTEYNNTIRDLLGIVGNPADDLPSDPSGYGFDNIGDVQFIPPVLVEKYLDITKTILRQLFADPALRKRVVIAEPSETVAEEAAVRQILQKLLPAAFRRPVKPEEIDARVQLFARSRQQGRSYDAALQVALESVLLSPHFLLKMEGSDPATEGVPEPRQVNDHELAVRLSYFLWSTMPDARLVEVADRGELRDPKVLAAEVTRMLEDPKSRALADNFAAQWLRFREMLGRGVDFRAFPEFNNELGRSMYDESAEFFDHLFRTNGKVVDILDADYTFLNERLAKHYGIPDVTGEEMQRVQLPDRRRGGILGMGSILTVTSFPTRTSPVLRGKWVLEELFGAPPPPPPANIDSLAKTRADKEHKTLRKRMEAHRAQASCAACHKQMDPIGFGLENFNGIGAWRDQDEGEPIDTMGELPGGMVFRGPEELKAILRNRYDALLRNMIERMFTYAVGRPVEYYDERAIRQIIQQVNDNDGRVQPMIQALVASEPFQYSQDTP